MWVSAGLARGARRKGLEESTGKLNAGTRNGRAVRGVAVSEGKDAKTYSKGHRARLQARYRVSGNAALQDYEFPEMGQHEIL